MQTLVCAVFSSDRVESPNFFCIKKAPQGAFSMNRLMTSYDNGISPGVHQDRYPDEFFPSAHGGSTTFSDRRWRCLLMELKTPAPPGLTNFVEIRPQQIPSVATGEPGSVNRCQFRRKKNHRCHQQCVFCQILYETYAFPAPAVCISARLFHKRFRLQLHRA